jgi:hypothetical protein
MIMLLRVQQAIWQSLEQDFTLYFQCDNIWDYWGPIT